MLGPYESAAQELNETKRQEARTKKKKQTPTERNVDTPTEGLGHAHHEAGADWEREGLKLEDGGHTGSDREESKHL